jgi:hypothetical protein
MKSISTGLFLTLVIFMGFSVYIIHVGSITGRVVDSVTVNMQVTIPPSYLSLPPGHKLLFTTKILNFENLGRRDINLKYIVLNSLKKEVSSRTETVAIETQASFVGEITLPEDLPDGAYVLQVTLVENASNQMITSASFSVEAKKPETKKYALAAEIIGGFLILWLVGTHLIKLYKYLVLKHLVKKVVAEYQKRRTKEKVK